MKTAAEILAKHIGVIKVDGVKWDRISNVTNKVISAMEEYANQKADNVTQYDETPFDDGVEHLKCGANR